MLAEERILFGGSAEMSQTGSFGWSVQAVKFMVRGNLRIFEYDRATKPTVELMVERTHREDVAQVKTDIERASQDGKDFVHEHRLAMRMAQSNISTLWLRVNDDPGTLSLLEQ